MPPADLNLEACDQGHVLAYWEEISEEEHSALVAQVKELDATAGVAELRPTLMKALDQCAEAKSSDIAPPPADWVGFADGSDAAAEERWEKLGLELAAAGACAACVLAGGMGTRLGSSYPKGMLGDQEVGEKFLPSGKSLFQVYAERVLAVQRRAQKHVGAAEAPTVWFLVMTGEATHALIVDFFERRGYFGLRKDQVLFFQQGLMPCFAPDGKMLMETKGRIAVSPDGNAGIYPALQRSGVLDKLSEAGVKWVQAFSVDNVLVRVADPVWYGYQQETGADVCVKTVAKRDWSEAVGVVTLRDGLPGVIEYSEIGEVRAKEQDASGTLKYNAANICLQAYSLDFLRGPALTFPKVWHVAKKDIPTIDGKVPGIKLETFIFDVFAVAKNFRMLQVDRAAEFSAIKNASDSGKPDTPATALQSISRLHRSWLRKAGAAVPEDGADGGGPVCEIAPSVSYRGEGLEERAKEADVASSPIIVS